MTARRADKDEQPPEVEVEVSAAEKIENLNSQLREGSIGPHKVARPPFSAVPCLQGIPNPRPSFLWQFDQEFSKAWSDVQSTKSPLGNDGGSRRFDRSNSQRFSGPIDAN